ncbi:single-stranded DNA-binding protein [Pseudonocardia sp. WMMC193]|uniref:single-stranded DNA-binding protein n=1 Tax=Pseudonocardia sp. WMMC193 TaxID=2911965 RepID=UPI001F16F3A3|nr:single-stranded DNA-binding protein [Pseudonocardia sp. WMMC193]MCF7552602.1 single-stranded DNA-binding protein [Pseudonocardia sp. WMMC193]
MNENTFRGNLGRAPEIAYGRDNGTAVCRFSIAINSRRFNKTRGEWEDRPTVWKNVVCFGQMAQNAYDTLAKGMTVTVTGTEADDSYTRESRVEGGEDVLIRQTVLEAIDVAVSLTRQVAEVRKITNEGAADGGRTPAASVPEPVG